MAAVDDLIAQIADARLRNRLAREWAEARQGRKFGLVFEQHLPELLAMPRARPRAGALVCVLDDETRAVWRVRRVADGMAWLMRGGDGGGDRQEMNVATDRLQVVRQFGDPIFPALAPVDRVQNGGADAPWHTLIEADNYHALQLLEYLYAGKVDCIYIDPPYNTGARDWKYNNDYVDKNDAWRHSKWLAFMERRLRLAKRLLNPNDSVLVVTIDEHEIHHLGVLVEQLFSDGKKQMVTIVIQGAGSNRKGELGRVEEYAFFVFFGDAVPHQSTDDLLNAAPSTSVDKVRWESLLRSGTDSQRVDSPNLFFPVFVNNRTGAIVGCGESKPVTAARGDWAVPRNATAVWPFKANGSEGRWRCSPSVLRDLVRGGFAKAGAVRQAGRGTIWYLGEAARRKIENGEFAVQGVDAQGAKVVVVKSEDEKTFPIKTVWNRARHHAGWYGTNLVGSILPGRSFPFPKSLYSVLDALRVAIGTKPSGLVLDFFAGSGTTLHAANLLNASDSGQRRCILVTNNEVSGDEADSLRVQGLNPGDDEWESHGICQYVTWPRSKYTILGKRDDGATLDGEYLTGKTREVEKTRKFTHIGFVDPSDLDTVPKRKQLVALIDRLPQTLVKADTPFVVSESHDASVLFDPAAKDAWLEALEEQDHVARFFIVAPRKADFDAIKAEVQELLGPLTVTEEEKRPMAEGFAANVEYFRLDFLDPARVQLRRAFREILPLLWLKAGAVGPRPTVARNAEEPDLLLPDESNFGVLLRESKVRKALPRLAKAPRLDVMYLVTDDEESFRAMGDAIRDARGEAGEQLETVQLYRNYLDNFTINRADGAKGARP
jgi:adenine-specific DNA-methyltransferase